MSVIISQSITADLITAELIKFSKTETVSVFFFLAFDSAADNEQTKELERQLCDKNSIKCRPLCRHYQRSWFHHNRIEPHSQLVYIVQWWSVWMTILFFFVSLKVEFWCVSWDSADIELVDTSRETIAWEIAHVFFEEKWIGLQRRNFAVSTKQRWLRFWATLPFRRTVFWPRSPLNVWTVPCCNHVSRFNGPRIQLLLAARRND